MEKCLVIMGKHLALYMAPHIHIMVKHLVVIMEKCLVIMGKHLAPYMAPHIHIMVKHLAPRIHLLMRDQLGVRVEMKANHREKPRLPKSPTMSSLWEDPETTRETCF